jgi:hypothetical protein
LKPPKRTPADPFLNRKLSIELKISEWQQIAHTLHSPALDTTRRRANLKLGNKISTFIAEFKKQKEQSAWGAPF